MLEEKTVVRFIGSVSKIVLFEQFHENLEECDRRCHDFYSLCFPYIITWFMSEDTDI